MTDRSSLIADWSHARRNWASDNGPLLQRILTTVNLLLNDYEIEAYIDRTLDSSSVDALVLSKDRVTRLHVGRDRAMIVEARRHDLDGLLIETELGDYPDDVEYLVAGDIRLSIPLPAALRIAEGEDSWEVTIPRTQWTHQRRAQFVTTWRDALVCRDAS